MRKFDIRGCKILITESEAKQLNVVLSGMSDPPNLNAMLVTDENGLITSFSPVDNMQWGLIFLLQNLMVSQRLFLIDNFLRSQEVIK
jgi:hypothetical protein